MNKSKIYIGLGIITVVIFATAGFFVLSLQKVTISFEELEDAEHVINAALNLNVENFHTQLEVWEYAFDPNQTRLLAFQDHQKELNNLLGVFVAFSRIDDPKIFDGGISEINAIRADVGQVNADWERMLPIIAAGNEEAIYKAVIANEELFDRLEFNENIDTFVEKQLAFVDEIEEELFDPINSLKTQLFIFLIIIIVFIVSIGIWMSKTQKDERSYAEQHESVS